MPRKVFLPKQRLHCGRHANILMRPEVGRLPAAVAAVASDGFLVKTEMPWSRKF